MPQSHLLALILNDDPLPSPSSSYSISYLCNPNQDVVDESHVNKCKYVDCPNRVKRLGVCWKHGMMHPVIFKHSNLKGGHRDCTVKGCSNRVKARGLCWAHGGGKPCKIEPCSKTALRYGLCWSHGGGKRCREELCRRPAYERNDNYCHLHYIQRASQL